MGIKSEGVVIIDTLVEKRDALEKVISNRHSSIEGYELARGEKFKEWDATLTSVDREKQDKLSSWAKLIANNRSDIVEYTKELDEIRRVLDEQTQYYNDGEE